MVNPDYEALFLGLSIFTLSLSVAAYIMDKRKERKEKKEEFAERAAVQTLSPLLVEIHSLEKACELLTRYPDNFGSLRRFFVPEKFQERISKAYVFLSNPSFEQNSLNLLMLLYHVDAVFESFQDAKTAEHSQLIQLATEVLEVVIPLRQATLHAIDVYRKQIGVRRDIDYPIPFNEVVLQIEEALHNMGSIIPSKLTSALSTEDQGTANKISALWAKKK
ncbi:MAG: hypothetical protein ACXAB4_10575 [Candidatus Hodarchaeales archaeon]|jgi:hypothetical protein